jgi:hypothetical protein
MEDDDVGIAGGSRCAGKRGECPDGKALLGQSVGQESAIDCAVLDEKDTNFGPSAVACYSRRDRVFLGAAAVG